MRNVRWAVLLAACLSLGAFAGELPYLTAKQVDLVQYLPTPNANGSPEDLAQQQLVLAAQKAASPERIALAAADAEESVYAMFGNLLGPNFRAVNLPITTGLFARIGDTEDAVVDPIKSFYGRKRPFLNNPEIKPLVKPSKSGSYPSGHTTRSTMMAIVLATMLPEKRAAIFARANEYAESRVIGGMHYPQDLDGGRRSGTAIAATLLASPTFQPDLEAAKTELRHALGL